MFLLSFNNSVNQSSEEMFYYLDNYQVKVFTLTNYNFLRCDTQFVIRSTQKLIDNRESNFICPYVLWHRLK